MRWERRLKEGRQSIRKGKRNEREAGNAKVYNIQQGYHSDSKGSSRLGCSAAKVQGFIINFFSQILILWKFSFYYFDFKVLFLI